MKTCVSWLQRILSLIKRVRAMNIIILFFPQSFKTSRKLKKFSITILTLKELTIFTSNFLCIFCIRSDWLDKRFLWLITVSLNDAIVIDWLHIDLRMRSLWKKNPKNVLYHNQIKKSLNKKQPHINCIPIRFGKYIFHSSLGSATSGLVE